MPKYFEERDRDGTLITCNFRRVLSLRYSRKPCMNVPVLSLEPVSRPDAWSYKICAKHMKLTQKSGRLNDWLNRTNYKLNFINAIDNNLKEMIFG